MVDVQNRYIRIVISVLLTLWCLVLFAQLRGFLHDVWVIVKALLLPFLAAMIVTYVLQPIVEMLVRRRVPRGVSILIIYLAFVILILVAVLNAIPVVSRQFTQLNEHLPQLVLQADKWIDNVSRQKQYLPDALRKGVESALGQMEQNLTTFAAQFVSMLTGTVNAVMVAFVVPFLVFYMLKDAKAIGRTMVKLSPRKYRQTTREVLAEVDETLGKYVRGQLLVMLAVGVLTYIGLLIVGMPYAMLLALFVAMTNIIPYLGPFLGAAPALILAFSISPQLALKVLVVNLIVQQCEGNFISPQIMGRTLDLHPMAIVAALLIGGEVGGILGLVVAVPVLAVAKVAWIQIRKRQGPPESV